jgi:hypothetical protein
MREHYDFSKMKSRRNPFTKETMAQIHDVRPQDADDLRIISDQMDLSLRKVYRPTQAGYANRSRISTIRETGNVLIFKKLGFEVVAENPDKLFVGIHGEAVTDVEMENLRFRNQGQGRKEDRGIRR